MVTFLKIMYHALRDEEIALESTPEMLLWSGLGDGRQLSVTVVRLEENKHQRIYDGIQPASKWVIPYNIMIADWTFSSKPLTALRYHNCQAS